MVAIRVDAKTFKKFYNQTNPRTSSGKRFFERLEINAIFRRGQWASPYLMVEETNNGMMVNSRLQDIPGLDDRGKIVIEDQQSFQKGLWKHLEEHYEEDSLIFFTEEGTLKWKQGKCQEKVPGATYGKDPDTETYLGLEHDMDRFVLGEKRLENHLMIPSLLLEDHIERSKLGKIKVRVSGKDVFLNLASNMNLHQVTDDEFIPPRDYIDDPGILMGRPLRARGEIVFETSFKPLEVLDGGPEIHLYFDRENQLMAVDKNTGINGHVHFCMTSSSDLLYETKKIEKFLPEDKAE